MEKKVCFYCGEDDDRVPKLFEEDHIFGRKISSETITLCLNCHAKKTYYQNKLPLNIRKCLTPKSKFIFSETSAIASINLICEKFLKIVKEMSK